MLISSYLLQTIQKYTTQIYSWAQTNDCENGNISRIPISWETRQKRNRQNNEFLILWWIFFAGCHLGIHTNASDSTKQKSPSEFIDVSSSSTTKLFRKWFQCLEPKDEFVPNKRVCRMYRQCECGIFCDWVETKNGLSLTKNSILLCTHKIVYSVWIW